MIQILGACSTQDRKILLRSCLQELITCQMHNATQHIKTSTIHRNEYPTVSSFCHLTVLCEGEHALFQG